MKITSQIILYIADRIKDIVADPNNVEYELLNDYVQITSRITETQGTVLARQYYYENALWVDEDLEKLFEEARYIEHHDK
jgi:hypothetical protein